MQRWVWLNITTTTHTYNLSTRVQQYYVPEDIVQYIPSYKSQLDQQLASIKGDDEPVIQDQTVRDPNVVGKALRFLASGYLCPLDATSITCKDSLDNLVKLYKFSIALSIKHLETAILRHIDTFEELSLAIFLAFARNYYNANGAEAQNTSLGYLIKKKLAAFLQHMVDLKTVDVIKNENGILGRQLIEVLLEERAERATGQKRDSSDAPIKIED